MSMDEIIQKIAEKDGVSPEYVREQMELAIQDIYANPNQDPLVAALLEAIPHQGEIPTIEEVVPFLAGFALLQEEAAKHAASPPNIGAH